MTQAEALAALLDWQAELGADAAISDAPIDRYQAIAAAAPVVSTGQQAAPSPPPAAASVDPAAEALRSAAAAPDLPALEAALAGFAHCDLRQGARNLVFADGRPGARVMIVGEAPGRDEDQAGRPFVGRAGQLLDRMLTAIGLDRSAPDAENAVYITNMVPWRPPQNRTPTPAELAMFRPFVERHITLADPDVLVVMGNAAAQGLLDRKGITRLRGSWLSALDRPCLPMLHPAYLLRSPGAKREAWHDLLALRRWLDTGDQISKETA